MADKVIDIKSHLISRGVNLKNTKIFIDHETNEATFLIYNLSGQIVGYQKYDPLGSKKNDGKNVKYTTIVGMDGCRKKLAVYGLETLKFKSNILFVVEGIFDSIKLHNLHIPTIAVLSNNPKHLKLWLKSLGRMKIAILDNDDDPQKSELASMCDKSHHVPGGWKDLGEMGHEDVTIFMKSLGYI